MSGNFDGFLARFVDRDGETVWEGFVPKAHSTVKVPSPPQIDFGTYTSDKAAGAAALPVKYREFELAELTYRESVEGAT